MALARKVLAASSAAVGSLWRGGVLAMALLLTGCSALPVAPERVASHALTDTAATRLGRAIEPMLREHPGQAGLVALADGREAFATRLLLLDAAERSIDLQTYIFHADATGTLMFERLLRAADRGVRVRLLLDDNNTVGLDPLLALLDAHANIEVRLFNPHANRGFRMMGFATDFSRLNRRMHNKSLTVDNQATVVGGRNIGDEYFQAGQGTTFADLDVIAIGGAVQEVSNVFDRYWNSASAYPAASILAGVQAADAQALHEQVRRIQDSPDAAVYIQAVADSRKVQELLTGRAQIEWAQARLVYDEPEKVLNPTDRHDLQMLPQLEAMLGRPLAELDLVSPYFVPGEAGALALQTLAKRGVRVRVLTNSLAATDVTVVHAGYAKWREDLLRAGVTLLELKPSVEVDAEPTKGKSGPGGSSKASLHAKTFEVDRQRIFVGSFNLDPRSARLNTEMGMVIDSPLFATQLASALDRLPAGAAYELRLSPQGQVEWVDAGTTVYTTEPQTGALRRATVKVLSWLPIEWML